MSGFENIFFRYPGSISTSQSMGTNPARVHRITGDITLNQDLLDHGTSQEVKWILSHEAGHFLKNTRDEFLSDKFAFDSLAGQFAGSLKSSISALSRHLPFDNPEHLNRLFVQFMRALRYDFEHNGNIEALITFNELKNRTMNQASQQQDFFNTSDPYLNLTGKERRNAKKDLNLEKKQLKNDRYAVKTDKKQSKADLNRSRGAAKETKADSKRILAENGGAEQPNWWDKTLGTVSSIFGKNSPDGSGGTDKELSGTGADAPKFLGMPKTVGIIVTVLVGLGVLGLAAFLIFGKKS